MNRLTNGYRGGKRVQIITEIRFPGRWSGPSLVAVGIAFACHRRITVPQESRQCNEKRSVPWYSDKTATPLTPCRPDLW